MKLLVQARKDGYNVLYPKPTPKEFFQFAGDIRRIDNNKGNFLGKYIYSIALTSGGCIFSKHVIVQDVQREGLGNVGFSVFIPNVKKLSGVDVKILLDKLLKTYCENYCPDYYLENKHEDWTLFEAIVNKESLLPNQSSNNVKSYQHGTGEAAFVYYSNNSELEKYFNAPYQEKYCAYKQVFFVEEQLKFAPENPLNAVRHDKNANLTGEIDFSMQKVLVIHAFDKENHKIVTNFKLIVNDKVVQENDPKFIFINDQISTYNKISVEHSDYETEYFYYNPSQEESNKNIYLIKKQHYVSRYHGGNNENNKWNDIDKKKGERSYKGKQNDNYVYKINISRRKLILIFSIFIAFFCIFLILHKTSNNSENNTEISNKIASYVEEIELNKDRLEQFKSSYCNSTSTNESNESRKNLWQRILHYFRLKDDETPSQESPSLPDYCSLIDDAISIRNAINQGKIDELIGKKYSEPQKEFKSSIDNIEDKFKKQIGDTLIAQKVSLMNLNKIAELIQKVQNELKEQEQIRQDQIEQQNKDKKQKEEQGKKQLPQSSELLIKKNSLETEFWILAKEQSDSQMDNYVKLVKKYWSYEKMNYLKSNLSKQDKEIISFLKNICENNKAFEVYANISIIDRVDAANKEALSELKKLLKNQE